MGATYWEDRRGQPETDVIGDANADVKIYTHTHLNQLAGADGPTALVSGPAGNCRSRGGLYSSNYILLRRRSKGVKLKDLVGQNLETHFTPSPQLSSSECCTCNFIHNIRYSPYTDSIGGPTFILAEYYVKQSSGRPGTTLFKNVKTKYYKEEIARVEKKIDDISGEVKEVNKKVDAFVRRTN
ncbi:hypothetical protein BDZ91DRAFT_767047 [Kalaharituber pfeilii]|nr:hypothetical protein BDZ91DRAFT_767047 [Kalaharituber pfeilii]